MKKVFVDRKIFDIWPPALRGQAERIREVIEERCGDVDLKVVCHPMDEFDARRYSAEAYLISGASRDRVCRLDLDLMGGSDPSPVVIERAVRACALMAAQWRRGDAEIEQELRETLRVPVVQEGVRGFVVDGSIYVGDAKNWDPSAGSAPEDDTNAFASLIGEDDQFIPPAPCAAFADHFTDVIYYEFSSDDHPFGSDEGFDVLVEWAERRTELEQAAEPFGLMVEEFRVELDQPLTVLTATLASSSLLATLYLVGRVEPQGMEIGVKALEYLRDEVPDSPSYAIQIEDLRAWEAKRSRTNS